MGVGLLLEAFLLLASSLAAYGLALHAFSKSASRQFSFLPSMLSVSEPVKGLVAATFAVCCALFELIVFETTNLMTAECRKFFWQLAFVVILGLLIVLIPAYQILLATQPLALGKSATIGSVGIIWSGFFLAFWSLTKFADTITSGEEASVLELFVSRVSVIGVTLIALVSGFGSASAPHHYFVAAYEKVSDHNIREVEKRLALVNADISSKRQRLVELQHKKLKETPGSSLFGRMLTGIVDTFSGSEADRLVEEMAALELVYNELAAEVDSMAMRKQSHEYYGTWQGKVERLLGKGMSLYCIYRLFSAAVSLIFGGSYAGDPVSKAIGVFVHIVNVDFDARFWSQQISFLMVGGIIIATVRTFMMVLSKLLRRMSISNISNIGSLFLAQIMGLYFVATLLLLKLTLPPHYRPVLAELLKAIRLDFYGRWFDLAFLLGALGCALVICMSSVKEI